MAGAAVLQVLRQGVWASLTGGCFLDPQLGAFANCVRLYVWLFLLGLPLGLYSALPPSPAVAALYCGLVAAFFGTLKAVTFRLHARLDRGDPEGDPEGGAAALLPPRSPEERDGTPGPPGGGLELSVLRWPSATPPQLCGFNQLSELLPHLDTGAGELRGILTAADRDRLRSVSPSPPAPAIAAAGAPSPNRVRPPLIRPGEGRVGKGAGPPAGGNPRAANRGAGLVPTFPLTSRWVRDPRYNRGGSGGAGRSRRPPGDPKESLRVSWGSLRIPEV
ncbi:PREDICTED: pecanex-like protein 3 [Pseudopodoces humilis]|uniref:pecanex-like protein 3 n=1 Tax=Pseudopodoces humilis TaxID=181119 RepID=UPI0006B7BA2D|nr:PREDICTED: pecanex-like protein 3 [Pseudopodoces humilis]